MALSHGFPEIVRSFDALGRETGRALREGVRKGGEVVKQDASRRIGKLNGRSAAGLRVRIRTRGVDIEQGLRRVTGRRPDWGATQVRKMLLARDSKLDEAVEIIEQEISDLLTKHGF